MRARFFASSRSAQNDTSRGGFQTRPPRGENAMVRHPGRDVLRPDHCHRVLGASARLALLERRSAVGGRDDQGRQLA
jgi:hypothetical protein